MRSSDKAAIQPAEAPAAPAAAPPPPTALTLAHANAHNVVVIDGRLRLERQLEHLELSVEYLQSENLSLRTSLRDLQNIPPSTSADTLWSRRDEMWLYSSVSSVEEEPMVEKKPEPKTWHERLLKDEEDL